MSLKEHLSEYYKLQRDLKDKNARLSSLKDVIISQLKRDNLTDKKFKFDNDILSYNKYTSKTPISIKHLNTVLKHYPSINPDEFISLVEKCRQKKTYESLRFTPRK